LSVILTKLRRPLSARMPVSCTTSINYLDELLKAGRPFLHQTPWVLRLFQVAMFL